MTEIASAKASAESMDCRVFFEGTPEQRAKWFGAAKDEMTGMSDKQVLESLNRNTLRRDLGLGPNDVVPRILPTKLVTSRRGRAISNHRQEAQHSRSAVACQGPFVRMWQF